MFKYIKNNPLKYTLILCAFIVLIISYAIKRSEDKWNTFIIQHKCKVIAYQDESPIIATTFNGTMITGISSSKTAYLCDDNITYWK